MVAVVALLVVIALVGGVLALVFSGAGDPDEPSPEALKSRFIQSADAICTEIGEETAALESPTDLQSTGEFLTAVLALLERQTTEIEALQKPQLDIATLEAWLDTQSRLATAFESAASAANEGDQSGFDTAFAEVTEIQSESTRVAIEYGFTVCGIATPS
jgi:hypothetical protein